MQSFPCSDESLNDVVDKIANLDILLAIHYFAIELSGAHH